MAAPRLSSAARSSLAAAFISLHHADLAEKLGIWPMGLARMLDGIMFIVESFVVLN